MEPPADQPNLSSQPPTSDRRVATRHPQLRRLLLLAVVVAGCAAGALLLPLDTVPRAASALGAAGPAAAVAAGALLVAALVPRTAVSFACGALFGVVDGFWCALAAAVLAAILTFLAGRWAGRGFITARAGGRLHRLDGWLARRGLLAVVVVRLLPLAPYGLVGYAYGATSVRRRHYIAGSLIGATPSCFSYAVIGAAVVAPGQFSPVTLVPAAFGLLVSSGAAWHWRRTARRAR
ncbi:MAG TPA: VTT domain-containing protein [Pilimelia sp.]|nr:VTT domain-containing protein [Pilimelia sp.]